MFQLHPVTVTVCIATSAGTAAIGLVEIGLVIIGLLTALVLLDLFHIWSRCQERKKRLALFRQRASMRRSQDGGTHT